MRQASYERQIVKQSGFETSVMEKKLDIKRRDYE